MAGKFEPKVPVTLDPPKDDPITLEELAKADGKGVRCHRKQDVPNGRQLQRLGLVNGFDRLTVPRIRVFVGKDASRALAKSSTKPEDVQAEWKDLGEKEIGVLNDWITFFSKRYNIVGVVQGATNME
ncbi:hypothetical protein O1611_g400 [Lasiodiplodia mahajangana]|uniref:Uncharacterized protein n=1 Tax=Lasiodiplodia mahajangana TaxID=1108764 RepID=A0ACC2K192_9PEZI|nr:hypothetical protein O1611_g400 [Lasiodiplodia mahajangana]